MKIAKLLSNVRRYSRFSRTAICISLLVITAAGCGGKIPQTHYYTLKFPPPSAASDPSTTLVLDIEPFRASMNLRDDRIVYYESPTQFSYYTYHVWNPDPATLLGELARRRLNSMAVFQHVRMTPSREPSDYTLKGHLLNFEELDYEQGGKVRVALDLRLVRTRDQKTVWTARREVLRNIEGNGVPGVVDTLSAASDQILSESLPGLVAEVEREFKESPAKPQ